MNMILSHPTEINFPPHLLRIDTLSSSQVNLILQTAQQLIDLGQNNYFEGSHFKKETVATLFFENSTRTLTSFTLAAKRLGMEVINLGVSHSSLQKGETLLDTLFTLYAMHCRFFVIRHPHNQFYEPLLPFLPQNSHLLNAGDGTQSHPTQALLDLLTIQQRLKCRDLSELSGKKFAILGDSRHSRVARSFMDILRLFGVQEFRIIAPREIAFPEKKGCKLTYFTSLDEESLSEIEVLLVLRLQKERIEIQAAHLLELEHYYANHFCLRPKHLSQLKESAVVLHPGPFNRNIELAEEILDDPHLAIWEQVRNGLAIRMACLQLL